MAAGVLGVAVRKTLLPDLFCATGELDLAGNFTVPAAGLQKKLRAAIQHAGPGLATVFVPSANVMDDGSLEDHDTKDGTTSQVRVGRSADPSLTGEGQQAADGAVVSVPGR